MAGAGKRVEPKRKRAKDSRGASATDAPIRCDAAGEAGRPRPLFDVAMLYARVREAKVFPGEPLS